MAGDGYLAAMRARRAEEARRIAAERARARADAEALAPRLGAIGATRVVLFGSLARGGFGSRSDVDLAVEGLRGSALEEAQRLAFEVRDARVSIVPLERAHEHIVDAVRRDGVVLWSRP